MIHDNITRDANSGTWAEIWEFSKSQRDISDAVIITKIIVVDIICYVDYHSSAKFKLPISQSYNMATKCDIWWSWKPKVKPNLDCRCNIAITISYILVMFHPDNLFQYLITRVSVNHQNSVPGFIPDYSFHPVPEISASNTAWQHKQLLFVDPSSVFVTIAR